MQVSRGWQSSRATAGIVMLVLMRGFLADLCRNLDERVTGRFHLKLNVGGFEQ